MTQGRANKKRGWVKKGLKYSWELPSSKILNAPLVSRQPLTSQSSARDYEDLGQQLLLHDSRYCIVLKFTLGKGFSDINT